MSDTPASIHEFDFSLICEYFSALERQGPGSPAVTVQALGFVDRLTARSHIADIGFARGINEWRKFLKPGGFLAVSEASWFSRERPEVIDRYWRAAYPEIDLVSTKVGQLEQAGYVPVAAFVLPETCWSDHFYAPQTAAQERFLRTHAGSEAAAELVATQRHEAELYGKYKQFYGYAFSIGRKM